MSLETNDLKTDFQSAFCFVLCLGRCRCSWI